ncbi:23098_t:CDS:2, partial [Dentiscutata erythropus]
SKTFMSKDHDWTFGLDVQSKDVQASDFVQCTSLGSDSTGIINIPSINVFGDSHGFTYLLKFVLTISTFVMSSSKKGHDQEDQEITRRHSAPYLSGLPLKIVTSLLERVPGLSNYFYWNAGLTVLRHRSYREELTIMPLPLPKEVFGVEDPKTISGLEIFNQKNKTHNQVPENQRFLCARDFTEAYTAKKITPLQVCEKLIDKINHSSSKACDPPLYGMYQYHKDDILAQAEASTFRYNNNQSLGPLDGVPVAVKDEIDVTGYETRVGTSFLNRGNPALKDAFLVKRLRDQGAIIIGKTNMHEIGFDGGSACVVARLLKNSSYPKSFNHISNLFINLITFPLDSGLCPIAIGCDGGGSIRIPSSFCGIYGLKSTCGRISSKGEFTADGTRYAQLANFIGIPAVTVPAGYDDKNLPIGLQFMAKWYDEATLLRVAKVSEEIFESEKRRPAEKYWFGDLL